MKTREKENNPQQRGNQNPQQRGQQDPQQRDQQNPQQKGQQNPQQKGQQNQQGDTQRSDNFDQRVQQNWDHLSTRLREDYDDFTDEDLRYERGKESDLYGRIQKRTGMNRPQFEDWANNEMNDQDRRR